MLGPGLWLFSVVNSLLLSARYWEYFDFSTRVLFVGNSVV